MKRFTTKEEADRIAQLHNDNARDHCAVVMPCGDGWVITLSLCLTEAECHRLLDGPGSVHVGKVGGV